MPNLQSRIATGLTRLWVVVSILWIGLLFAIYMFNFFENPNRYVESMEGEWLHLIALMFGPPLALAVVLIVIGWIIDGFTE